MIPPQEFILVIDDAMDSSRSALVGKLDQVAASDQIWKDRKSVLGDSEELNHASDVAEISIQGTDALRVIPSWRYAEPTALWTSIQEAYASGCRVANLSIGTFVATYLNSYPEGLLQPLLSKYSKPTVGVLLRGMEQFLDKTYKVGASGDSFPELARLYASILEDHEPLDFSSFSDLRKNFELVSLTTSFRSLMTSILKNYHSLGVEELLQAIRTYPDMTFVLSAGNGSLNLDAKNRRIYPLTEGSFPNVIVVTSVDREGSLSSFSNYGRDHVHLAAEGGAVLVQRTEGSHFVSGTSYATPQVARTCAKMRLIQPSLSPTDIRQILQKTVKKSPHLDPLVAWGGILDEDEACKQARDWVKL